MAKSSEIQARRDCILDIFRDTDESAKSVEDVFDILWSHEDMRAFWEGFEARQKDRKKPPSVIRTGQGLELEAKESEKTTAPKRSKTRGHLNVTSAFRLVQRDLEVLEQQGLVEATLIEQGARVVVTAGDRRARAPNGRGLGPAQPLLWRAGPNLRNDMDLEGVAAVIALEALCGKMAWLVPESLMSELLDARDMAQQRVARMKTKSPQRRWLAALKLETPSSAFERPMFDEDVRQTIEQAIMQRKQVRLSFGDRVVVASISRFIVKLPDRPVVEIWEDSDDALWPGGPKGPWSQWLRLETIQRAELLSTEASWPTPLDEDAIEGSQRGVKKLVYEIRASPLQVERWGGTWLLDQMELMGKDPDGWSIFRYVDTGEPPSFRRYLTNLGAAVEVLAPLSFRTVLAQHFESAAAMYRDMQDVPPEEEQARLDEETLAAWGGIPRVVRPDWVPFTRDDHERLQRSPSWRMDGGVIEGLCRLFASYDPAGVCSTANPHSATEYLHEVEQLFALLTEIRSERALADAIRAIILQNFTSPDPSDECVYFDEWEAVATVAWLELTDFRVRSRKLEHQ